MKDFSNLTVLISGACGVTSRTVVRALKNGTRFRNCRLIGTDICDNPYGLYEGLYERIYRVPGVNDTKRYEYLMKEICVRENVNAAIFIPEPEVAFWAKHYFPASVLLPPKKFTQYALSKQRLYGLLSGTDLIPAYEILPRTEIPQQGGLKTRLNFPFWMRDYSEGSTSGKGAILINSEDEAYAWITLNSGIETFMLAEFLPGRNIACLMLYVDGELDMVVSYERIQYFMAHLVISGISGNISQGRLVNDDQAEDVSVRAIESICRHTGETMTGLVTIDLKATDDGLPKITEINLRPVAAASAFSKVAGANIIERHLLATLGVRNLQVKKVSFPADNRLLRDIDGTPIYVPNFQKLEIGQYVNRMEV